MSKEEYRILYSKLDVNIDSVELEELNKKYTESNTKFKIGDILYFSTGHKKLIAIYVISKNNGSFQNDDDYPCFFYQTEPYDITKATAEELVAIEVRREEYKISIGLSNN